MDEAVTAPPFIPIHFIPKGELVFAMSVGCPVMRRTQIEQQHRHEHGQAVDQRQ